MIPYISVEDADDYFEEKVNTILWTETDPAEKLKALKDATKRIDRLNFSGEKADPDQELQFPRGIDILVPEDIQKACCEIAFKLLDGIDVDMEVDNLQVEQQSYHSVRTSYNREHIPEYLRAGIPSALAWSYLVPYLRDPREIKVN